MTRALIPHGGNDVVYTPIDLAYKIVSHYQPIGLILEPCAGSGVFVDLLPGCLHGDIATGQDFLIYPWPKVDWVVTNPPWSKFRPFLIRSMELAQNIVFLVTVNHFFTKARLRDIKTAGFSIVEIALVPTPKEFPQSGFQLAAVHLQHTQNNLCRITEL